MKIECWSCGHVMTFDERQEAEGMCQACSAEVTDEEDDDREEIAAGDYRYYAPR